MKHSNEEEVVMSASSGHQFHDHQQHCDDCRSNVMSADCQEGNRALRETVRSGTAFQSDRDLDALRNGPMDEE